MIWIGEVNNQEVMIEEDCGKTIYTSLLNQGLIEDKGIDLVNMSELDIAYVIWQETHKKYNSRLIGHRYSIATSWGEQKESFDSLEDAKSKLADYVEDDKRTGYYEPSYWIITDNINQCVVCEG